jgi:hypothetical protein
MLVTNWKIEILGFYDGYGGITDGVYSNIDSFRRISPPSPASIIAGVLHQIALNKSGKMIASKIVTELGTGEIYLLPATKGSSEETIEICWMLS